MDETRSGLHGLATNDAQADWSADTIADQILRNLNGSVTRETILRIVKQVAPRYADARIRTFVPILIQRDVMNELFAVQETLARPGVEIRQVHQPERS
jgi:hypothetical protein